MNSPSQCRTGVAVLRPWTDLHEWQTAPAASSPFGGLAYPLPLYSVL